MVEEKDLTIMKYIRTYETEEKFLTDKDSTSRGFRLKPTLYKYSEAGDHVHLELDDPRKHGDSTWIRLEFTEATEFSFKISNVIGDDSNTLNYTIDWGDGTVETNTATRGDDKLYTFTHNYAIGIYDLELYDTDRSYMLVKRSFSLPTSVKRVVVESGVEIGSSVFNRCSSLTSINIPEGTTSIGESVFEYCSSLTSVNIPEGVTSIGVNMFDGCSSLTSINLPSTLTSLGTQVFWNCSSLTSITIPESVTSISDSVFWNCSSLTSINIPEGVTSISKQMFNGCSSLTSVNIPSTVTSISSYAFSYCKSLTSINIPEGVTSIGASAFDGCSSLTSVNIPSTVTSIGAGAFRGCSSLTSINIPEGVTSIGKWAFSGCRLLNSISSYNSTAPTLGTEVFKNMQTTGTLHIKPGATGYDAWLSQLPSGWTIVEDL